MLVIFLQLLLLLPLAIHAEDLGELSANPFNPDSTSNPFGAGSPFKADGLNNPFSPYRRKHWGHCLTLHLAMTQFSEGPEGRFKEPIVTRLRCSPGGE